MTLTPIATPVGLLTRRAHLAQKVLDAWPYQPPEISRVVIAALENPRTTVDYLLWLGDLFGDAASELSASGKVAAYHGMVAMRHLVQDAAGDRAAPEAPPADAQPVAGNISASNQPTAR